MGYHRSRHIYNIRSLYSDVLCPFLWSALFLGYWVMCSPCVLTECFSCVMFLSTCNDNLWNLVCGSIHVRNENIQVLSNGVRLQI